MTMKLPYTGNTVNELVKSFNTDPFSSIDSNKYGLDLVDIVRKMLSRV
jgi:hypothetical protein